MRLLLRLTALVMVLELSVGCFPRKQSNGKQNSTSTSSNADLGELFVERPSPTDESMLNRYASDVGRRFIATSKKEAGPGRRDTHVKTHQCVKAKIEVLNFDESSTIDIWKRQTSLDLSSVKLKVGFFEVPRSYEAIIRFANGNAKILPDSVDDLRAMSIKVLNVPGKRLQSIYGSARQTQDFLFNNSPIFTSNRMADFFDFSAARDAQNLDAQRAMAAKWPKEMGALAQMLKRRPESLLLEKYWSSAAFSQGEGKIIDPSHSASDEFGSVPRKYPAVVKHGIFPIECATGIRIEPKLSAGSPLDPDPLYYRKDIETKLSLQNGQEFCFEFAVQLQTDPKTMSIEDAQSLWNESKSPFVPLARITIPKQDLTEARIAACEQLHFSPWLGLAAHRPLGELNRIRRLAYPMGLRSRMHDVSKAVSTNDIKSLSEVP